MDQGSQDGLEILLAGLQVQDTIGGIGVNPDVFNPDLRDWYEERAAFLEYCEGLNRETAERLAFAQTALKKRANL